MEQYIGQTPSELLTLLVDGQLEDTQASVLFSELSQSGELRTELQEHLAIRESVRGDIEAFTPSLPATKRVFASAGIDPIYFEPAAGGGSAAPASLAMRILKKFGGIGVAVILASLATTYIVSKIYENRIDGINAQRSSAVALERVSKVPVISSTEENSRSQISAQVQSNVPKTQGNLRKAEGRIDKTEVIKQKAEGSEANAIVTDEAANSTDINLSDNTEEITIPAHYESLNESNSEQIEIVLAMPYSQNVGRVWNGSASYISVFQDNYEMPGISSGNRNITLSVRMQAGPSFEGNHNGTQPIVYALNGAIGILMPSFMIENLKVGIEGGKEPFHLKDININDYLKDTDKDPNAGIYWGGVVFRYDMPYLSLFGVSPWIQLDGGFSKHGKIIKTLGGLQYTLFDFLTLTAGPEYSKLWYKYNNYSYSTDKFGITSGVMVRF